MARSHRRFGRLFYGTATVALILIASVPFWRTGIEQLSAWRLAQRLHDPVEAVRRQAAEGLVQLGPSATQWVIRTMRRPGCSRTSACLFRSGAHRPRKCRTRCSLRFWRLLRTAIRPFAPPRWDNSSSSSPAMACRRRAACAKEPSKRCAPCSMIGRRMCAERSAQPCGVWARWRDRRSLTWREPGRCRQAVAGPRRGSIAAD